MFNLLKQTSLGDKFVYWENIKYQVNILLTLIPISYVYL
ncbi:hypothetical protein THF1D04_20408 [Vibrio owensii]|uniref:Uncharacterized protein n=1 Tax=Vibrio owensii TaxID=696485 RepID=A0AAU9Q549_9VIBR|nr:hypothetical protein THF1D04_20408 [Vibrio owensii]